MKSMPRLFLMVSLLSTLQLAGGSMSTHKPSAAHIFDLSAESSGQTLTVGPGDILRVSLGNSAGTGYSWHALEVDPIYLLLLDKAQAAPPTAAAGKPGQPPVVGGPGPGTVYVYYVKKSLNLGSYTVSTPIMFVNVPPGRASGQSLPLVQFNLTSK